MKFINLTPHKINVYKETQFVGLKQVSPTSWTADSVSGEALLDIDSSGEARISVKTEYLESEEVQLVKTTYGELEGIPSLGHEEVAIVSLPTASAAKASNHALADRLVTPFKVVRLSSNTSQVLGCMGFSFQ